MLRVKLAKMTGIFSQWATLKIVTLRLPAVKRFQVDFVWPLIGAYNLGKGGTCSDKTAAQVRDMTWQWLPVAALAGVQQWGWHLLQQLLPDQSLP